LKNGLRDIGFGMFLKTFTNEEGRSKYFFAKEKRLSAFIPLKRGHDLAGCPEARDLEKVLRALSVLVDSKFHEPG
jgi:hypothetical protein